MLALPDKGMRPSVHTHNVDLSVLCDWIEASVVFDDNELSKSDVIDVLVEEQVYVSSEAHSAQAFASERVDDAWAIIASRAGYLSNPLGINVSGNRIVRTDPWTEFSAYGFCMALSCRAMYSGLHDHWGNDYVEQGNLFEKLAAESLGHAFPGWVVKRVGWSGTGNPITLQDALQSMIDALDENEASDAQLHVTSYVKDLGLDLLAYYSFKDRCPSNPIVLVQCASGLDWRSKRYTPDIDLWKKIIQFNSQPLRGFAMPFAFASEMDFRREAAPVNGLFVDRYRLLRSFCQNGLHVSANLASEIEAWVSPRIAMLQRAD